MFKHQCFRVSELKVVKNAEAFRDAVSLGVGDRVILNSGSPVGLVVDLLPESKIVVAWPLNGSITERHLSAASVHLA